MKTAQKAHLRAYRDQLIRSALEDQDDGQTEREHGDVDVPLEADEPEVERDHPDSTPDGDSFA